MSNAAVTWGIREVREAMFQCSAESDPKDSWTSKTGGMQDSWQQQEINWVLQDLGLRTRGSRFRTIWQETKDIFSWKG